MVNLHKTENPISRQERVKINQNWDAIREAFMKVRQQMALLAGGQEVDEIIARIETAVTNAEKSTQDAIQAIETINEELPKALLIIQQGNQSLNDIASAIQSANTATSNASTATSNAEQAAQSANTAASNANDAKLAAEQATINANNAKDGALTATSNANIATSNAQQATSDALNAIAEMQSLINHFLHRGEWNSTTDYFKNNLVSVSGRTYIALQDNTNVTVTSANTWALFADKGEKGEKGDTGAALSIMDRLTDVSQLPSTGQAGQAYTVNGDLYVWSENINDWINTGSIKGEKGEDGLSAYQIAVANGFVGDEAAWVNSLKGERGEKGETGASGSDANVTSTNIANALGYSPANSTDLTALDAKLTTHLDEKANKVGASETVTIYVSPTGDDTNDGGTSLTPFKTLQKAFDYIKSVYSVIDGKIKIDLAEGIYEQTAFVDSLTTRNRIEIVGKIDTNGVPTVIFDGSNNQDLPYAMTFSSNMYVKVSDIKVQNFSNSSSRSGIVAQQRTNLWTKNVHVSNCGFAGINVNVGCTLYVEGGIIEACRIGIRVYSNCVATIGYGNPTQNHTDPNRLIVRNCTETGVLVYNMSTGHLDFSELDGNRNAVTIQNSSRLHVWKNLIKNSSVYGVLVTTSATWYDDDNTYQNNTRDYKHGAFSSELSQYEDYTPTMKIEPTVFVDTVTHTGVTTETYLNTINTNLAHILKANSFIKKGQKLKIIVTGTFVGTGTKTLQLRVDTGLIAGFTSVQGSTRNFSLEVDMYAINSGQFKVFGRWLEGNAAFNTLFSPRSFNLASNRTITVTGTLSDASGSIVIETFEVREIV